MFDAGVVLFLLLSGASTFMIHNTHHSLCLENSVPTGEVLLRRCNLDSKAQQWIWKDRWMLMAVSSSGCLSAQHSKPIQTTSCQGPEVQWDCTRNRLISKNTSLLLSADGQRLTLSHDSEQSKWSSLDKGDICQVRSRRASEEAEESEDIKGLTEEEKEYLQWFYRTEDSSTWVFVLLVLAFICLLVGFLLLGMGVMASKSRKKIAKYKAAAAGAQRTEAEELQVMCDSGDNSSTPQTDEQMEPVAFPSSNGNIGELSPGNILVTWKDGNTSDLYESPAAAPELQEDEQEAEGIKEQIEGSGDQDEEADGTMLLHKPI